MESTAREIPAGSVIVFYDGVCGFCNRTTQFVGRHDTENHFRFAPLQGGLAAELLLAHDVDPSGLDTVYVLTSYGLPDETVYTRAHGILRILTELGGLWRLFAIFSFIPKAILDPFYLAFAKRRYDFFGRYDECPIPDPSLRAKFVDVGNGNNESEA